MGCDVHMQYEDDEQAQTGASNFMTVDFINSLGKRYNFEQVALSPTLGITLTNRSGDSLHLKFWTTRQSERDFPLDKASAKDYEENTLPAISEQFLDKVPRSKVQKISEAVKWCMKRIYCICREEE